jgi:GNAT superfamily N-acetyltransferase
MIQLKRSDSEDPDFVQLVRKLDKYLAEKDGADHSFYAQFNEIDNIKFVVVAYDNEKPVGCGAMKEYASDTMEIKRMYVSPESRGKGIAGKILSELENWASGLSITRCVLETGKRQPEAIRLYHKSGYRVTPNYGPYANMENSVCFEKTLKASPQDQFNKLFYYTLGHPDTIYFIHQHAVDAFTAQQATEKTKPIGLTFALVGLYLFLEKNYSGRQVQQAHMHMGKHKREWPIFGLPTQRGEITVSDVIAATEGPERDAKIKTWCASVWQAYHEDHRTVETLVKIALGEKERTPGRRH